MESNLQVHPAVYVQRPTCVCVDVGAVASPCDDIRECPHLHEHLLMIIDEVAQLKRKTIKSQAAAAVAAASPRC